MVETLLEDPRACKVGAVKSIKSFAFFVRLFFLIHNKEKFIIGPHHYLIFQALERVVAGKCKRLIINIAPRYGKTELVVKMFIAYGLALNAAAKFIHLSYSDDLALDNSETIKDLVSTKEFQSMFPAVKIKKDAKAKDKWYTTAGGGVLARSTGGQVTGFGAGKVDKEEEATRLTEEDLDFLNDEVPTNELFDIIDLKLLFGGAIIIDDAIKPEDGDSETVRQKVNMRYDSTIKNRVNSRNTPIIIIGQRVHPEDLCGMLIERDKKNEWEVLSLPCVVREAIQWYDGKGQPRITQVGEALWLFKHTLEELKDLETENELVYSRQYDQDPEPATGLMFPRKELHYFKIGEEGGFEFTYLPVDPANLGGDDFAAPVCKLKGNLIYVTSVLYNTDGEDLNSERIVNLLISEKVDACGIEGVFGWAETAKNIRTEAQEKEFENEIRILKPRTNKHVRIASVQAFIRKYFRFREDWQDLPQYAKFMRNLTTYLKVQEPGKTNKHDEAPDVCHMATQYFQSQFPQLWPIISKK